MTTHTLIVGLDLSFNSTGLTFVHLENNNGKSISFHRVKFDDCKNKTGKAYLPTPIQNVSDYVYKLPSNIVSKEIVIDTDDTNNVEQCDATIKAIVCSQAIQKKIVGVLGHYEQKNITFAKIIFCFENYVMPSFNGKAQLKSVSGLIMLQGFVRQIAIGLCLQKNIKINMLTPAPKTNKLFFCGNGKAEKDEMLNAFIDVWDGKKLLPQSEKDKSASINDVIDSFALAMYAYSKINK